MVAVVVAGGLLGSLFAFFGQSWGLWGASPRVWGVVESIDLQNGVELPFGRFFFLSFWQLFPVVPSNIDFVFSMFFLIFCIFCTIMHLLDKENLLSPTKLVLKRY